MHYQMQSKNASFVNVHKQLKEQGIKNNRFMLSLYNKSLTNFDPFDPNLSKLRIDQIRYECAANPWYYLREVVRIPIVNGDTVYLKADRGSIAQTYCSLNGINTWLTKPRATLMSGFTLALLSWFFLFGRYDSSININSKHMSNNAVHIVMIMNIINALPEYLPRYSNYSKSNLRFNYNKNIINSNSLCNFNIDDYEKLFSAECNYVDDASFVNSISDIIKKTKLMYHKGKSHINIFTSVRDYNGEEREKYIISHCLRWNEEYYDIAPYIIMKYAMNYSGLEIIYIEYDWKSLGLSEEWVKDQEKMLYNDDVFKGEVLLEWNPNHQNTKER